MRKSLLVLACLCLLWIFSAAAQGTRTLTIFAAASLTDALLDIAAAFEAEHEGVDIVFSFGGSSQLAAQIMQGAPADVFASANMRQMQTVIDAGLSDDAPHIFAYNRLVLITPADNPANVRYLRDLSRGGVKIVLAAPDVPVRDYTDAMLEKMARGRLYGPAYRDAVLENVVSEEGSVRQVAAKIALGEADAGIVYLSDVTPDISDSVAMIAIPDRLNTRAEYPIVTLNTAADAALARAFVDYILSDAGQAALKSWNFIPAAAQAER